MTYKIPLEKFICPLCGCDYETCQHGFDELVEEINDLRAKLLHAAQQIETLTIIKSKWTQ